MKKVVVFCLTCILFSCTNSDKEYTSENIKQMKLSSLKWILGDWERTNNSENRKTFEHWEKVSNKEYKGIGYTLNEKADTVFKENLRIYQLKDSWIYEVSGVNAKPTNFSLTSSSNNSFVCENQENPFPKKIEYVFSENTLKATISGGDDKIDFIFKKVN